MGLEMTSDKACIVSLMIETRCLEELRGWEPVGSLVDLLTATMCNEDGITKREISRMRLWAKRWDQLHPDVKRFYQLLTESPQDDDMLGKSVETALWLILHGDGSRVRPTPAIYRVLGNKWTDIFGTSPMYELIPNLNHITLNSTGAGAPDGIDK